MTDAETPSTDNPVEGPTNRSPEAPISTPIKQPRGTTPGVIMGDRVCAKCHFNLIGTPIVREPHYGLLIATCPECGHAAPMEEFPRLAKTRVRLAAMGVVAWLSLFLITTLITSWILGDLNSSLSQQPIMSLATDITNRQFEAFVADVADVERTEVVPDHEMNFIDTYGYSRGVIDPTYGEAIESLIGLPTSMRISALPPEIQPWSEIQSELMDGPQEWDSVRKDWLASETFEMPAPWGDSPIWYAGTVLASSPFVIAGGTLLACLLVARGPIGRIALGGVPVIALVLAYQALETYLDSVIYGYGMYSTEGVFYTGQEAAQAVA